MAETPRPRLGDPVNPPRSHPLSDTPPPAPPPPPSAGTTPVAAKVVAAVEKSLKDSLAEISVDLVRIGRAVPTPNVLDSHLHGQQLQEIATKLKTFSEKL